VNLAAGVTQPIQVIDQRLAVFGENEESTTISDQKGRWPEADRPVDNSSINLPANYSEVRPSFFPRNSLTRHIPTLHFFKPGKAGCVIGRSTLIAAWSDRGGFSASFASFMVRAKAGAKR
jgi:hypothetical protein